MVVAEVGCSFRYYTTMTTHTNVFLLIPGPKHKNLQGRVLPDRNMNLPAFTNSIGFNERRLAMDGASGKNEQE